jgi:hypothetical protein
VYVGADDASELVSSSGFVLWAGLLGWLPGLPDLLVSLTLALPRTFSVVAMAGVFRRGATK